MRNNHESGRLHGKGVFVAPVLGLGLLLISGNAFHSNRADNADMIDEAEIEISNPDAYLQAFLSASNISVPADDGKTLIKRDTKWKLRDESLVIDPKDPMTLYNPKTGERRQVILPSDFEIDVPLKSNTVPKYGIMGGGALALFGGAFANRNRKARRGMIHGDPTEVAANAKRQRRGAVAAEELAPPPPPPKAFESMAARDANRRGLGIDHDSVVAIVDTRIIEAMDMVLDRTNGELSSASSRREEVQRLLQEALTAEGRAEAIAYELYGRYAEVGVMEHLQAMRSQKDGGKKPSGTPPTGGMGSPMSGPDDMAS